MKQGYEGIVRMYDEDIFVDTKTKMGYSRVLRRIDPLLCKWSSKTYIPGHSFDDIKQELSIIIIEGIEAFDPSKRVKLSSFLHTHLRNKLISKIKCANKISNDASCLHSSSIGDTCECGGKIIATDSESEEKKVTCKSCGAEYSDTFRRSRDELSFSSVIKNEASAGEEYLEFQNSISDSDNLYFGYKNDFDKVNLKITIEKLEKILDEKTFGILKMVCLEGFTIKDAAAKYGLTGWAASIRLKKLIKNKEVSEIIEQFLS
jgi:RNA polymerase sigma factor (sigma-70 family)